METGLRCQGDDSNYVNMTPQSYTLRSFPNATRGEGVAFILPNGVMDSAVITLTFPFKCTSFELAQLSLTVPKPVHLFCVYRPPPSKQNKSAHTIFLYELADFLEHCNLLAGKVLIAGVLHVHFDRPADHVTARVVCPMSPPTDADMDPLSTERRTEFFCRSLCATVCLLTMLICCATWTSQSRLIVLCSRPSGI